MLRFTDRLCKSRWSHCGFGMESENIEPETCGLFLAHESHTWWVEKWHSSLDNNSLLQITGWNSLQSFIPEHRNRVSQQIRQRATRKLMIPQRQIVTSLLPLFIYTPHFKPAYLPPCIPFSSCTSISILMTLVIKTDDLGRRPHEWPRGCLRAAYRCPRNGSMDV